MIKLFQEKAIKVVHKVGSPTSAQFLAEKATILAQLKCKGDGESRWGLYHISEGEAMSWFTFAEKLLTKPKKTHLV